MRYIVLIAVLLSACSSSPTSPTPPPTPPVVVTPPVVMPPPPTPPIITPPADLFPPTDPRFSMSFYRQFALNGFESPDALQPLRRKAGAPNVYLMTVDDSGRAIDATTLDMTAAALINTVGALTGRFGLASLQRGTGHTGAALENMITVVWESRGDPRYCGYATVGVGVITLSPRTPGCRCSGNPAAIDMTTVKHELGHALGFYHTDAPTDLMYGRENFAECDKNPSAREVYHASVAYGRPIGSLDR